jgi:hypothetical protein
MIFESTSHAAWITMLLLLAPASAIAQKTETFLDELAEIAKNFDVEIITSDYTFPVKTDAGEIRGSVAKLSEIAAYAPLFAAEFRLYPPSLIRNAKLKRVVLCTDVAFAGQRRNAIPDFENDTLYLDVLRGFAHKKYLRKVIHHEFFHMIDLHDDGKLYRDERWAALNPKEHRYGDGGRNAQDNANTSVLSEKFPGFLNHYSTTGVEEDKAEFFANLLVEPEHVQKRAESDAVLKSKVELLRAQLADFCPEMNADFWKKTQVPPR